MAQMGCPGLSPDEKSEVWRRWRSGESLSGIGRAIDKHPASVFGILKLQGGINSTVRHRSSRNLSLREREEISRGIACWPFHARRGHEGDEVLDTFCEGCDHWVGFNIINEYEEDGLLIRQTTHSTYLNRLDRLSSWTDETKRRDL